MKRNLSVLLLTLFFSNILPAQTLNLDWVKQLGYPSSTSFGISGSGCVDGSGNVYSCGYFMDTLDFDPGPSQLLAFSPAYRGYLVKLNNSGNLVWAKFFDGYWTSPYSMTIDASGNLLMTGFFVDTVDFDPGPGTYTLVTTPVATSNAYVLKMDPNGNLIWARSFVGSTNGTEGASIVTDPAENVYTTGRLYGTSDFDPGPGTFTLSPKATEPYISKLDVAGNFVWAKHLVNTVKYNTPLPFGSSGIAIDNSSNIYITGTFRDSVDFDPNIGTFTLATSQTDAFVAKYTSAGNFIWAKQFTGGYSEGSCINTDPSGNVYVIGRFVYTVDFDPGSLVNNLSGGRLFACRLDGSGNFNWVKRISTSSSNQPPSFSLFPNLTTGEICIASDFQGTSNFDSTGTNVTLTSLGSDDIFITKLDFLGNFFWVKQMGGTNYEYPYSISHDTFGNLITTGYFGSSPCDFDPEAGTYYLNSMAASDVFLHKTCKVCVTSIGDNNSVSDKGYYIYPNPVNDQLYLVNTSIETIEIKLFSSTGEMLMNKYIPEGTFVLNTEDLSAGVYFVSILSHSGVESKKLIKQ